MPANTYYLELKDQFGVYHSLQFPIITPTLLFDFFEQVFLYLKDNYNIPIVFGVGNGAYRWKKTIYSCLLEPSSGDGTRSFSFTLEYKGTLNSLTRNFLGDAKDITACGYSDFV